MFITCVCVFLCCSVSVLSLSVTSSVYTQTCLYPCSTYVQIYAYCYPGTDNSLFILLFSVSCSGVKCFIIHRSLSTKSLPSCFANLLRTTSKEFGLSMWNCTIWRMKTHVSAYIELLCNFRKLGQCRIGTEFMLKKWVAWICLCTILY